MSKLGVHLIRVISGHKWTLHQSSHDFAALVHGFATKTKALTREIPPAAQATWTLSLNIFCKNPVVDENFLILAIDRG